jgi:transglutaminase-like putative cysteine protease
MVAMKKIPYLLLILLIVIGLPLASCSLYPQEAYEQGEGSESVSEVELPVHEEAPVFEEKAEAVALFEVFQHLGDGSYFFTNNPIFFDASASKGPRDLSYKWKINGENSIDGPKTSYIFEQAGTYSIELEIFNGKLLEKTSTEINVKEIDSNINKTKGHELIIEVVYLIKNKGPSKIENMEVVMDTPQTNYPFQQVKGITLNHGQYSQTYDKDYNLLTKLQFENIEKDEEIEVKMTIEVKAYEFDFPKLGSNEQSYRPGDFDLLRYTGSEDFIDSDNEKIRKKAEEITAGLTEPFQIAEALYRYVTEKMEYDYSRLDEKDFKFLKASEILDLDKGICTDYSILYAALLRSKGIPAKVAVGIPVYSIASKSEGYLEYGHAWVEAKLPYYGWVPLDITSETPFMSYNYFLNLKTFEGIESFYDSGSHDNPIGVFFRYGNGKVEIDKQINYMVRGFDKKDITVLEEKDFLNSLYPLINEYFLAINHVNSQRPEGWVFNDPDQILLEESLLKKFRETEAILANKTFPHYYSNDMQSIISLASYVGYYKQEQLSSMKDDLFEQTVEHNGKVRETLDKLVDYYNGMLKKHNDKYN